MNYTLTYIYILYGFDQVFFMVWMKCFLSRKNFSFLGVFV